MYHDRTALLIDQDASRYESVRAALHAANICLLSATDAATGIATALAARPQLIMLSLALPDSSVADVIAELKRNEATSHVPILVLAGAAEGSAADHAIECGADDALVEPWRDAHLRSRVNLFFQNEALCRLLERQVRTDALTTLPNRFAMLERLRRLGAAPQAERSCPPALLLLNLDGFKAVNDSLGLQSGDVLLCTVARRIRECIREHEDLVARIGDDEFAVIVRNLSSPAELGAVADRLIDEISRPLVIEGVEARPGTSIGLRLIDAGLPAESLLRDAEIALHHAKRAGGGRVFSFEESMRTRLLDRVALERDLCLAVERGELTLVYQPIISLSEGHIHGFEALVRWRHPSRGLVSPADFIPLAEESGLIVPMGSWILREAARQARDWNARWGTPTDPVTISVNVSKRQLLDPHFLDSVGTAFEIAGVRSDLLKLEITESAIVEDSRTVVPILSALREAGCSLHMDDFGTGYSSLSSLHQFPLHGLKLDKSFIDNLNGAVEFAAIIHSVVTLAHNLNLEVVAEGIETPDQLVQLQALDCDRGQGYLFSKPIAPAEAEVLLAHRTVVSKSA